MSIKTEGYGKVIRMLEMDVRMHRDHTYGDEGDGGDLETDPMKKASVEHQKRGDIRRWGPSDNHRSRKRHKEASPCKEERGQSRAEEPQ